VKNKKYHAKAFEKTKTSVILLRLSVEFKAMCILLNDVHFYIHQTISLLIA